MSSGSRDGSPALPVRLVLDAAASLFPGYFALVMATGVLSIAGALLGFPLLAVGLLAVNWVAFGTLSALTILRLILYPRRMAADLFDHRRAPGFFTTVAATCVLGAQSEIVGRMPEIATALWYAGAVLWAVITYAFFTAVTVGREKPVLAAGINGGWLVSAVATQSLVVLGTTVHVDAGPVMQLLCAALFMIGVMLYLAIIPLILQRFAFAPLAAHDFAPPYWINMGALAITALAGALLIQRVPDWSLLNHILPFVKGVTLFSWAVATWWIPLLATLMIWRHVARRDPLVYEPQLWSLVFPLGMYTTGTYELALAFDLPFLDIVPRLSLYVAALAWLATFVGLLTHLGREARARLPVPATPVRNPPLRQ